MNALKLETALFTFDELSKLTQQFNYEEGMTTEETALLFEKIIQKYKNVFDDKFIYFQHFIYAVHGADFYEHFCNSGYNDEIHAICKMNTNNVDSLTLKELINLAANLDLTDEDIFNWYLGTIQNMIGVKAGDTASWFFAPINMHLESPEDKVRAIKEYVAKELMS